MKFLTVIPCLVVAASLVECERDSGQRIPAGIYEEPSGRERVTATDKTLQFEVRMLMGRYQGEFLKGEYSYELLTNGKIHVISISSDPVFMEGILPYHWFWDGEQIIRQRVEAARDENNNLVGTKPLGSPVSFTRKPR